MTTVKQLRYTKLVMGVFAIREDFSLKTKERRKAGQSYGIFGMVGSLFTDFRGFGGSGGTRCFRRKEMERKQRGKESEGSRRQREDRIRYYNKKRHFGGSSREEVLWRE